MSSIRNVIVNKLLSSILLRNAAVVVKVLNNSDQRVPLKFFMTRLVIVDTDGGCDDAMALILLLAHEKEKDFKIIAVTIVNGNTTIDYAFRNIMLVLESVNRIDIPVYIGASTPLLGHPKIDFYFHGLDGFGDLELGEPVTKPRDENAVEVIQKLVTQNRDVSIICLGPLTNIALLLRTYNGLSSNINALYIMGGALSGNGNITQKAEFNFYIDPESAEIVLSSSECRVILLPYEPCLESPLTMDWRLNDYAHNFKSSWMTLLTVVDQKIYPPNNIWNPCDAFIAAVFIDSKVVKTSFSTCVKVEVHDKEARGMSVSCTDRSRPNIQILEKLDFDIFKNMLIVAGRNIF